MRYISIILIAAFAVVFSASGNWHLSIWFDGGILYEIILGVNPSATDGFDVKLDKPAPPVPPAGFFPYFPCNDKKYSYLPALWGDIRHPEDDVKWTILLRNTTVPVVAEWDADSLPAGYIAIDGTDLHNLNGQYNIPKDDTVLIVEYRKRAPIKELNSPTSIKFSLPKSSQVIITISDRNGNVAEKIGPKIYSAGEHIFNWNTAKNSGIYIYTVEADSTQIATGKIFVMGAK